MAYKHKGGGDLSTGGKFLREPGTYHVMVTSIDDRPCTRDGRPIDNAEFRVNLEVLDGTTPEQTGQITDIMFFCPKLGGKDDGKFARKKIDRFFVAASAMTEDQVLKEESVDIDFAEMDGRQFFATFQMDKENKHLELAFTEMYHIDDPKMATVPRDEAALKIIPPSLRRIGEQPRQKTTQQATPKPPVGDSEFGDI